MAEKVGGNVDSPSTFNLHQLMRVTVDGEHECDAGIHSVAQYYCCVFPWGFGRVAVDLGGVAETNKMALKLILIYSERHCLLLPSAVCLN